VRQSGSCKPKDPGSLCRNRRADTGKASPEGREPEKKAARELRCSDHPSGWSGGQPDGQPHGYSLLTWQPCRTCRHQDAREGTYRPGHWEW
jgi:hypothetical protein